MNRILIPLLLACTLVCSPGRAVADDIPTDATAQLADAGSGSDVAAASVAVDGTCKPGQWTIKDPAGVTTCRDSAALLPNPATSPLQAIDEAKEARRTSWPLAMWAVLAMAGKALAYSREKLKGVPLAGKLAAWLSVGKRAMWIAAIGAVGSAGYDVMIQGGSTTAALVAAGMAIAGISHSTTKGVTPEPVPA